MAESAKKKGRPARDKTAKHPHCFDFRRPVADPKTSIALWEEFSNGKMVDPNKGMLSAKDYGDAFRAVEEAEAKEEMGPSIPPLYDPIRRLIAARTNATCIVSGQKNGGKKPLARHNVPARLADSFGPSDRVYTDANGDAVYLRLCHAADARKLVTDSEDNVLTINRHDYVVGTPDTSAVFLINGSKSGCYAKNLAAAKEIAFKGMESELANLVGRFNNSATILTLEDGTTPGCKLPVHPNYFVTLGYMERGGRKMTPAQIRAAVEKSETEGMKFVEMSDPILSNPVLKSELDRREGTNWHDLITVQTRTLPNETYPFGLFSGQTGIAPFTHYNESSNPNELEMVLSFVVGDHCGATFAETFWEANVRLTPEGETPSKTEKKSEKKASAPKASKPKAPKVTKPKTAKTPKASKPKKKTKGQDADSAAPVETVNAPEPVAEETPEGTPEGTPETVTV